MTPTQIHRLNEAMEPPVTDEMRQEQAAAEAEYERKLLDEKWADWGSSPEQLAAQERMMAMMGEAEG